ncbi:zinc transport system substrate-binding protein [Propionicimonas paludicola]|uniref:Zinc transport system substrate-binding protein n=1 Tax=Propionicimonas paludicola TaxID=185243 RepID=A0A2A9CNZ1_9ACTN|nr:metal ABC transporter substrate-binding protein [Propionicimonas paludicola]PFG16177.1 zinc transport system substrate-binding protein [Propionicimonas paludicola]
MKITQGARIAGLASAVVLLAGCTTGAPAATTSAASSGSAAAPTTTTLKLTVAAYPLEFLAQRIAGDSATVTNLTAPGAEPHDLELTAKQMADLGSSDALIYIAGFQAAVDDALKASPPKLAIDASTGLALLDPAAAEEGEAPKPGAHDPHIWLSPANMITMAKTVDTALSQAHPELATTLNANTDKLVADLKNLSEAYTSGLATCQRKDFVTSHAAFAYLARDYGLTQIPIAGIDATEEPTAARIAEVQKLAKQSGVTTIFFETLVSPAVAKSIAGDLGLKSAVLDPIEGITANSAGTNYLEVMQSNLKALQEANGCS